MLSNRSSLSSEAMLADLRDAGPLGWQLFLRNLRSQYRQTLVGYVWVFVPPLAITALWLFLRSQQVINYQGALPYSVYLMIGMLWWQLFVECLGGPLRFVLASQAMLSQVNFPREALVVATLAEAGFNFLIRLLVFLPLAAVLYKLTLPDISAVLLGGATLLVLGISLGLLLVPVGILYRDIEKGLPLITQFWMYLTPVVYLQVNERFKYWQELLNPLAQPLQLARDGLLGLPTQAFGLSLSWLVIGLLLMFIGWMLYRLAMPILIERM